MSTRIILSGRFFSVQLKRIYSYGVVKLITFQLNDRRKKLQFHIRYFYFPTNRITFKTFKRIRKNSLPITIRYSIERKIQNESICNGDPKCHFIGISIIFSINRSIFFFIFNSFLHDLKRAIVVTLLAREMINCKTIHDNIFVLVKSEILSFLDFFFFV